MLCVLDADMYIFTRQGRLTINAVRHCHCVSRTCIHNKSYTFPIKSLHIGKSWLSQSCCWSLRSCGMWCRVAGWLDPKLSRRRSGLYFSGLTNSSSRTFRPLKMKAILGPEARPTSYPVTRHNIPQPRRHKTHSKYMLLGTAFISSWISMWSGHFHLTKKAEWEL